MPAPFQIMSALSCHTCESASRSLLEQVLLHVHTAEAHHALFTATYHPVLHGHMHDETGSRYQKNEAKDASKTSCIRNRPALAKCLKSMANVCGPVHQAGGRPARKLSCQINAAERGMDLPRGPCCGACHPLESPCAPGGTPDSPASPTSARVPAGFLRLCNRHWAAICGLGHHSHSW